MGGGGVFLKKKKKKKTRLNGSLRLLEPNVQKLLSELQPTDQVHDLGGWACPFNRAQWILDAQPFETRGFYRTFGGKPSQGGDKEWFTKDTWIQRDMCERAPWPFSDQQFDFVICSHTLEDIRDPLWVCTEMIRVGKRGYIEVPSRAWELSRHRATQSGWPVASPVVDRYSRR